MSRATCIVLSLLFFTSCSAVGASVDSSMLTDAPAKLDQPIDFRKVDYAALEDAIVRMTNAVRKKKGVGELPRHPVLAKAARKYANRMVDKGFLAHEDPTSKSLRTPADRIEAAGGKNATPAENLADVPAFRIASGQPFYLIDPDEPVISLEPDGPPVERHTYASYAAAVVDGWMNSPGHRRNLLDENAVEIGVGAAMYRQNRVPSFIVVQKFQLYEKLR